MVRQGYPTDLTDAEWGYLAPHPPPAAPRGRPRVHRYRTILTAICSPLRSGCAWRLSPADLPPWQTVCHYFRRWRRDGTRAARHTASREQLRVRPGRAAQPSAGSGDRQSVRTTGVGGPRGYDGGKKSKGRQRHLLVDTHGRVLRATVHEANVADRDGLKLLLPAEATEELPAIRAPFPRPTHRWLDGGYNGAGKGESWVEQALGWTAQIVQHPPKPRHVWAPEGAASDRAAILPPPGFRGVPPRRWVVERTSAWLGQNRRRGKDFERSCATGEALIYIAMTRLMVRRLARS